MAEASLAASPSNAPEAIQGTSSAAARRSAIQAIPFDRLNGDTREKVNAVLSNACVFRRLPVRAVNCDPDLYLFLIRHPDVVVNIWEVLGVSQIQLRQTDIDTFRMIEPEGTVSTLEFLYHSRDLQIVYGTWSYTGPILARRINGNCLAILQSAYSKDAEGRYSITARMDGFLSVEQGGADLLARAMQPFAVKNVDNNFIQTVAFLGSMSKTAEVNASGMQRLAARLGHVQPETREKLCDVVAVVSQRAAKARSESSPSVASRPQEGR